MKGKVLIVDDELNILKTVTICFQSLGFEVQSYQDSSEAFKNLGKEYFDLAFFDLKMYPFTGIQLLEETKKHSPDTTVVIITAHGSIESAVEAIKKGAYDYLLKPFGLPELQHFIEKVYEYHSLQKQIKELKHELDIIKEDPGFITKDQKMTEVVELSKQFADSNITILIEGESGTGKELLAKYIHNVSPRRENPFVVVNCSALPENLFESELFGHTKGAFTGAYKDREGRFQSADGGTIFLDEIAEVPKNIQVKLLRFLQEREFERIGDNKTIKVDVRVLAATNINLDDAMKNGNFREDLFFRINPVRLKLTPLRERRSDIPLLVNYFMKKIKPNIEFNIDPFALKILNEYNWPGNIRELQNVIERAMVLSKDNVIMKYHLPEELQNIEPETLILKSLEDIEKDHIAMVLKEIPDFDEAAKILQIDTTTLWRKRKKFNL